MQRFSGSRIVFSALVLSKMLFLTHPSVAQARPAGPNVVIIYADDLGFGDVSCYGAKRIKTPNIDRLASQGIRFTNAHSAAATYTPSRYAMLTGEYAWRKEGTSVLSGSAGLIIQPGRTTLPSLMKRAGFVTGVVGKWHLGLGRANLDYNRDIKPGPREIGFDYGFIIPATGDRVPCVYVENQRVVGWDPKDPIKVSYREPIGNEPLGQDLYRTAPKEAVFSLLFNTRHPRSKSATQPFCWIE